MTKHGLSFDVEDWQQSVAMRVRGDMAEPSRDVDDCVMHILDLCDELGIKATFFVVGLLARRRSHLVTAIASHGHEIASHSYHHRLIHRMTLEEFAHDIALSKQLLEDLTGQPVVGFRAPEFSVQRLDHPCFAVLREHGFEYDSSVFPVSALRYGVPSAPTRPFVLDTAAGALRELPLATTGLAGWRLPIAGGSHFRVLPTRFIANAVQRADHAGDSLVFYFHPYEFSKRWLYPRGGVLRNRAAARMVAIHNLATWRIERSLRAVAERVQLVPLRELASAQA